MKLRSFLWLAIFVLAACQSEEKSNLTDLSLMTYGFPLNIMAPDSAEIKKEDWISQQGLTIKKGDYDVQVWSSVASTTDVATVKAGQIAEVKDQKYFSKIVEEEEQGFIFETKLDSTTMFYGFRYIVLQGDREFTLQNGLAGNFTLEQAKEMYQAVKQK